MVDEHLYTPLAKILVLIGLKPGANYRKFDPGFRGKVEQKPNSYQIYTMPDGGPTAAGRIIFKPPKSRR
jgi:hypothetical protein